jgi:hypothetical protein
MFSAINSSLKNVNESKLFMGIIMIILNIGSKYIDVGFSKTQEQFIRNLLFKEILIFSITFTATRDIVTSLLITAAFVVLSDVFFHEKSKYCLIPNKLSKIEEAIDKDFDGIISPQEEQRALQILKNAEKQRKKNLHHNFMSNLNVTTY